MRNPTKEGLMSKRDIALWFDEKLPTDLPDSVVDALVHSFWEAEKDRLGMSDEWYTLTSHGGIVRIDTLNERMYFCSARTNARYRASMRLELNEDEEAKLRPWQRAAYYNTRDNDAARKDEAESKADALLATLVDPRTFQTYKETGQLIVPSKLHRTFYAFKKELRAGNISVIDVDRSTRVGEQVILEARAIICTAPIERYPDSDIMVAQLLHLRADEERFLQMANLHSGHWSEQELEVRARRPFYVVPRYDKRMGGYVNVPVDLPDGGETEVEVHVPFDHRKKAIADEDTDFDMDARAEQIVLWAQDIPQPVVDEYRKHLIAKIATLKANQEALDRLAEIAIDAGMAEKYPDPKDVDECSDGDLRYMYAKRWLTKAVSHWLEVLGFNDDEPEGSRRMSILGAAHVLFNVERQQDFALVDET